MKYVQKHRAALWAFAAGVILLSATALPAQDSQGEASSPQSIQLKSRTFTPAPGLEPSLRSTDLKARRPRLGLVQLEEAPDEAVRAQLEHAGVELLGYIPNNAWIAKLPADVAGIERAATVPGVRWVGPLLPEDKMAPSLELKIPRAEEKAPLALDVEAVKGSLADAVARIEALGGTVRSKDNEMSLMQVLLPRKAVRSLAESDAVLWISPDLPKTLFNNNMRINGNVNPVHQAPYGLNGAGVQLGIWDGGQIYAHGDFGTRLNVIQTGTISGHATHVAGTMAGSGLRSSLYGNPFAFPANHFRGVAYGADIIGYDFAGTPYTEHNAAINTYGIDNSQNSWGADINTSPLNNCALFGNYEAYSRAYDQIITGIYGKKIPVVFAAGNDRNDGDCGMSATAPFLNYAIIPPPATAKNVIAVGAINGDNSAMTDFSSWGPADDGRLRPDLVAAGCNAGTNPGPYMYSTWSNNGYAGDCGTSMAAPAVSGAIGILLQRYRAVCPASGNDPLPSTLKALLIHSARDLDDATSYLNRGPDYASGYGALDVKNAVDLLPFHHEDSIGNGGTDTFNIVVTRQSDLKVTLVWDDPAALANAAVPLINNLDLELEDPNGVIHYPWVLNSGSPSANATRTAADNRNVVEQVVVDTVDGFTAGTWIIRVKGTNVPSGPQTYSLVTERFDIADVSCAGAPAGDAWIMDKDLPDTPVDPGTEPNPDPTPMWLSNQIWVRYDDLGNPGHLNPEVGDPNFINALVKNNGTSTLNTVRVAFYVASSSTGLGYPHGWTLVGERTIVNLAPNTSKIVNVPWAPPMTGHYCLFVRLLSDQDPMTFVEGPNHYANTQNNNNIAWRNVDAYNTFSEGPVVVLFANTIRSEARLNLNFDLARDPKGATLLDFARVKVRLDEKLAEVMASQGGELRGFERIDDRTLEMVRPTAYFPELTIGGWEEFPLVIEVTPVLQEWSQRDFILDINQNYPPTSQVDVKGPVPVDPNDPNIGGVRLHIESPQVRPETKPGKK